MNPITNVSNIRSRLSGDSTPHQELVDIAFFAAAHLQEMMQLDRADKSKLYTRLVSECYNNSNEIEAVVSVAESFFKERVEGSLNGLSSIAKLHLFRCTEPSKLEMPAHALILLKMSKARREVETYRALLMPLLGQRLEGRELGRALNECVVAIRAKPENIREECLITLRKGMEIFPLLETGFAHLVAPAKTLEKLEALCPFIAKYTTIDGILTVINMAEHERLRSFRDLFPLIEDPMADQIDFVKSPDFATLKEWVDGAPGLSRCTTIGELKEFIAGPKTETIKRFNQIAAAFPLVKSGLGTLVAKLSDEKAKKLVSLKDTKPFSTITSGALLAFMLGRYTQTPENLPFIEQFCAAFPHLLTDIELLFEESSKWPEGAIPCSFKEIGLDKVSITDGQILNSIIQKTFARQNINGVFEPIKKCLDAYPLITGFSALFTIAASLDCASLESLELLTSTLPGLPFKDASDLRSAITILNGMSYFQVFYWGSKEEFLVSFKKSVLDRFPHIESGYSNLLENYACCTSEVWEFLQEPFQKEKSGIILSKAAENYELKKFTSVEGRQSYLNFTQRILREFPGLFSFHKYLPVPFHYFKPKEEVQNKEKMLDQILKSVPHLQFFLKDNQFEMQGFCNIERLLSTLEKIKEDQREPRLALLQKHLECCLPNSKLDVSYLFAIPVENQENILARCAKFDILGNILNYGFFMQRLSRLSPAEREALFANPDILEILPTLKDNQERAVIFEAFVSVPKDLQSTCLRNLKTWFALKLSMPISINLLHHLTVMPSTHCYFDERFTAEDKATISAHFIALLENCESNEDMLSWVLSKARILKDQMRLGDDESPLGQTIIRYLAILSDEGAVTPWTIYEGHKARLASAEKLPLPMLGKMRFNYERLLLMSKITPEMLPEGVDFAKLQGLAKAFSERYRLLDQPRKNAILSYINTILEKQFRSADEIERTIEDSWWGDNLNTQTNSISATSWKLFKAVDAISKESGEAGNELPGEEESEENFLIKEKLLSPREISLIRLLGQVQNCPAGKEWGLDNYISAKELSIADDSHMIISETIINHLDTIISSDRFLQKLLNKVVVQEPLHHAKYIRNVLSKELKFPLSFDAHTAAIFDQLLKMDPQKLLTAVFKAVSPPLLYHAIAVRLNTIDWKSKEGGKLYQALINEIPSEKLDECCKFDQEYSFAGITEKAVPYLLKHYGFVAVLET